MCAGRSGSELYEADGGQAVWRFEPKRIMVHLLWGTELKELVWCWSSVLYAGRGRKGFMY